MSFASANSSSIATVDSLLIRVEAVGPGVCHQGYRSCFFRELEVDGTSRIVAERAFAVEDVYGKGGRNEGLEIGYSQGQLAGRHGRSAGPRRVATLRAPTN